MTHKISMVIMSHLSDVQHMTTKELIIKELNFVKALVLLYPNTDVEETDEKLDQIYIQYTK